MITKMIFFKTLSLICFYEIGLRNVTWIIANQLILQMSAKHSSSWLCQKKKKNKTLVLSRVMVS